MDSGIPMNQLCPRCGGKHGIEVAGDGSEWDCAACGGHLICAIGLEGEMFPYHREDGTCGCVGEPHTCGEEPAGCTICGYAGAADDPGPSFAVWLHGRGWLIDVCDGEASVADRLAGATWFDTNDEARAVLLSLDDYATDSDLGTVVTL